jgi:hypothetical protein
MEETTEGATVSQDIDAVLREWAYRPGTIQARQVEASDGRRVIQLRLDLGLIQMETSGRPDGTRPHGHPTYFHYLQREARRRPDLVLNEEQCAEADCEFVQFYHRRMCWLALKEHARALADADHTLAFMDFVRDHAPSDEYIRAHEQYRGFVLFHRTQAAARLAVDNQNPEGAIDEIRTGLEGLRAFFAGFEAEEQMEEDGMVRRLRELERSLREEHHIEATLRERLEQAVAREDYETAARLRDALRRRD